MPFPVSLNMVTVTGTFLKLENAGPQSGKVIFAHPYLLSSGSDNVNITPGQRVATLDNNGSFTIQVPATDDAQWLPTQYPYRITLQLDGFQYSFESMFPQAVATVDLADIIPLATPPAPPELYVKLNSIGAVGGPAGPLDVTGEIPLAQIPDHDHTFPGADPATVDTLGIVQLAGDLGGTAVAPTVPALAGITSDLADKVDTADVGQPSGVADLDVDGNLPLSRLPGHAHGPGDLTDLGNPTGPAGPLDAAGMLPLTQLPQILGLDVRLYGAVGDGITDDSAAIQSAINAAVAAGRPVIAAGVFRINSGVQIKSDTDFSRAVFEYWGSPGVAVTVGDSGSNLTRRTILLPKVHDRTKPAAGLGWTSGNTGVRIINCYECYFDVPFIYKFEVNLDMRGENSGCVYNTIRVGSLNNAKVNLLLTGDGDGWVNQNLFLGGRFAGDPAEGVPVSDSAQIRMTYASPYTLPNNNTFVNPSLEGTMYEWAWDCDGSNNIILNGRFEGNIEIRWGAMSSYNEIIGGHSAGNLVETIIPGTASARNMVSAAGRWDRIGSRAGPMMRMDNTNSSAVPAWAIWGAATLKDGTTDVDTGWRVGASANSLGVKTAAQANATAALLPSDGSLAFGDGTAAPTKKLRNFGSGIGVDGTHLSWVSNNIYDVGLAANRPRSIRAATSVVVGVFTTAARNALGASHASLGAGAMIFDSTLGKPIWVNATATAFVDATGATV